MDVGSSVKNWANPDLLPAGSGANERIDSFDSATGAAGVEVSLHFGGLDNGLPFRLAVISHPTDADFGRMPTWGRGMPF